jgi:hypothetical protein
MSDFPGSSNLQRSESYSTSFRTTSREKRASWGNRFVRDHYDLAYEANPESISNRLRRKNRAKKKEESRKKEASP